MYSWSSYTAANKYWKRAARIRLVNGLVEVGCYRIPRASYTVFPFPFSMERTWKKSISPLVLSPLPVSKGVHDACLVNGQIT